MSYIRYTKSIYHIKLYYPFVLQRIHSVHIYHLSAAILITIPLLKHCDYWLLELNTKGNSMSNQQLFGMTPSELDKILHRHTTRGLTQPGGILALSVLWLRGYGPISSYLNRENCLPQTN